MDRTLVVAIAEMDFMKSVKAFTTFKESCLSEPVPVVTKSGRALALRYHGSLTGFKSMTQLIEPSLDLEKALKCDSGCLVVGLMQCLQFILWPTVEVVT